jgi:membrane protease YdiL (CAAX protease family)
MTVVAATPEFSRDHAGIPQYSLPLILFMFAWPAAWFSFLIYVIIPLFLLRPDGTLPLWGANLVSLLGNSAELAVALIILRREGYRLTPRALRERINLRFPDKLWKWGAAVGAFIAAVAVVILLAPLETQVATILPPPDWMINHPLLEVANLQPPPPDRNIVGSVLYFIYDFFIIGIVLNFIGEELYYRGALQSKMRGVFGRWDWVANGIGFALKHVYLWWRVPYLWGAGLALAFIYGSMGSLPLAIFFHWLGNTI